MSTLEAAEGIRLNSEVLKWFINLGLSPLQAQAYVFLVRRRGATADLLEEHLGAGVDPAAKALSQMEERGLVRRRTRDDVEMYYAVEPDLLITKLMQEMERKVEDARETSRKLLIWLAGLKPYQLEEAFNPQIFKLLYGPNIFSRMLTLTKDAKTEILRIASPSGLQVNMRLGLFEAERSCLRRGVDVRAIVLKDPLLDSVLDAYRSIAKVRLVEHSPEVPRLTIIDDSAIFFTSLPTTSPRKHVAMWTANRLTVRGLKHAFEDLWNSLPPEDYDPSTIGSRKG